MRPWTLTRRQLLAGGLVGGAGVAAAALGVDRVSSGRPSGGSGPAGASARGSSGPPSAVPAAIGGERTLVLIALYGGNDGLNTVVPTGDPAYVTARPTLGYQAHEVLPLEDGLGLNPRLTRLAGLWKRQQLAVVLGVGYPNPNLSHFDSMDIWQTANVTSGDGPGWVGTWLDGHDQDPLDAVSIGPTVPTTVRGRRSSAAALIASKIALPGPASEQAGYATLVAGPSGRSGWAAAVAAAGADLLSTRTELAGLATGAGRTAPAASAGTASGSTAGSPGRGGSPSLSDQLAIVAALIGDGAPTRVFHVSLSSYDTHADEKATHEAKLAELDAGIGSFFDTLGGSSRAAGTVVATYSEFGRRPAENASGGTDHGTASPLFVAGPGVRGGMFFGTQPSLTKLDANGNLIHTVDFRSVYASLLDQVIGANPASILGGRFPTFDLLR